MALFLVYDRDNTHSDPTKDARGCYKLGDIIDVYDDDKYPHRIFESPFYGVLITGITKVQALKYISEYLDPTDPKICLRRRLYNVEVGNIPAGVRATILANRYIEFTWSQVRNYIRNRMTNEVAGADP